MSYIILATGKYGTWAYGQPRSGQPNSGIPFREEEDARSEVNQLRLILESEYEFQVLRLVGRHIVETTDD